MPNRCWYICARCKSYVHSEVPQEGAWVCAVCSGTELTPVPGELAVEAERAGEEAKRALREDVPGDTEVPHRRGRDKGE